MIRNARTVLTNVPVTLLNKYKNMDYLQGVLEGHYNQTFRSYHNLDHIQRMLNDLNDIVKMYGFSGNHLDELFVAILFHDTVYGLRAKSPENEKNSADVAISTGMKSIENIDWQLVNRFIMATTHTGLSSDALYEEKLIADLDLDTLAGNYDEYAITNEKVRTEYLTMYTEAEFDVGRSKFLYTMLEREQLAYTSFLNQDEAKANMTKELGMVNQRMADRLK